MQFIGYNAVPIICIIAATVLAFFDKQGWGWLLLIAALLAVHPSTSSADTDDDPDDGDKEDEPKAESGNVVPIKRSGT